MLSRLPYHVRHRPKLEVSLARHSTGGLERHKRTNKDLQRRERTVCTRFQTQGTIRLFAVSVDGVLFAAPLHMCGLSFRPLDPFQCFPVALRRIRELLHEFFVPLFH